jgi:hypothetical protein
VLTFSRTRVSHTLISHNCYLPSQAKQLNYHSTSISNPIIAQTFTVQHAVVHFHSRVILLMQVHPRVCCRYQQVPSNYHSLPQSSDMLLPTARASFMSASRGGYLLWEWLKGSARNFATGDIVAFFSVLLRICLHNISFHLCSSLGNVVGYSIRLETRRSANTRLLFSTTGIMLRRLQVPSSTQTHHWQICYCTWPLI